MTMPLYRQVFARASGRWQRKSAEEALRRSEARASLLLEHISDVIAVVDAERIVRYVSPSVRHVAGYAPEAFIGNSYTQMIHAEDVERLEALLRSCTATAWTGSAAELRLRHRDGGWRTVEVKATNLIGQPEVGGYLITLHDQTERRLLEAQLRHAQKMETLGTLAGGVAHDFNNILTAIIGYTQLLLEQVGDDKPMSPDLREIYRGATRAAELTRRLLAFSRKQVLRTTVVDLNQVLADFEGMANRLVGETIRLTLRPDLDLWAVRADVSQIEQVLMNLIVNARDAMPMGGEIVISTAREVIAEAARADVAPGEYVVVSVRDAGTGMDEQTRERLFEPFFTTKPAGQGTGLGLATVYGIMQQMEGRVLVDSRVGCGTTFRLYFPRATGERPPDAAPARSAAGRPGKERILLVEDDEGVRRYASTVLRRYGYEVVIAADAREALLAFDALDAPPGLVVTDVVMPGMSGPELARLLRDRCPNLRVLFTSGYTEDPSVHTAERDPQVDLLEKPFAAAVLLSTVRRLLDRETTMPKQHAELERDGRDG